MYGVIEPLKHDGLIAKGLPPTWGGIAVQALCEFCVASFWSIISLLLLPASFTVVSASGQAHSYHGAVTHNTT